MSKSLQLRFKKTRQRLWRAFGIKTCFTPQTNHKGDAEMMFYTFYPMCNRPAVEDFIETIEGGRENTYVFVAPEIVE